MVGETKADDVLKTEYSQPSTHRVDESRVLGCKSVDDTHVALDGEWQTSTCERLEYPKITGS